MNKVMSMNPASFTMAKHLSKLEVETCLVKNIQRRTVFKSKSQENTTYCSDDIQMNREEKCPSLNFQSIDNPISHLFANSDNKSPSLSSNGTHSMSTDLTICNINSGLTNNSHKIIDSGKEEIMKPDKSEKISQYFGFEKVHKFMKDEKNKLITGSLQFGNNDKIPNAASESCPQSTLKREFVSYTEKKTEIKSRSVLSKQTNAVPTSKPNSHLWQPRSNDTRLNSISYSRKELMQKHEPIELTKNDQVSLNQQQFQNSLQQNCILQHIVYKSKQSCKMQRRRSNKPSTNSPRHIEPTKTPVKSLYVKLDQRCPISLFRKLLLDLNLSERQASFMFLPIYIVLKSIIHLILGFGSILDLFRRYLFACLSIIFGIPSAILKKIKDSFYKEENERAKQKYKYRTRENSRLLFQKYPRSWGLTK